MASYIEEGLSVPITNSQKRTSRWWKHNIDLPFLRVHRPRVRRAHQVQLALVALAVCNYLYLIGAIFSDARNLALVIAGFDPVGATVAILIGIAVAIWSRNQGIEYFKRGIVGDRLVISAGMRLRAAIWSIVTFLSYSMAIVGYWFLWTNVVGHTIPDADDHRSAYLLCLLPTDLPPILLGFVFGVVWQYRWLVQHENREGVRLVFWDSRVSPTVESSEADEPSVHIV